MITKIHIDIQQGIVSAEGDPNFVLQVYADYKEGFLGQVTQPALLQEGQASGPSTRRVKSASKKQTRQNRPKIVTKGRGNGIDPAKPKLDRNLDLENPSLKQFYSRFNIKNQHEALLVFVKYLIDEARIEKPNTNQIYTCFRTVKRRLPRDFAHAFRETKSKYGYIDYDSLKSGITITNIGHNHFDQIPERETSAE